MSINHIHSLLSAHRKVILCSLDFPDGQEYTGCVEYQQEGMSEHDRRTEEHWNRRTGTACTHRRGFGYRLLDAARGEQDHTSRVKSCPPDRVSGGRSIYKFKVSLSVSHDNLTFDKLTI